MSLETSMEVMKDSQIALNAAIKTVANKTKEIIDSAGQAGGLATLDENGRVPAEHLPEQLTSDISTLSALVYAGL